MVGARFYVGNMVEEEVRLLGEGGGGKVAGGIGGEGM